MKKDRFLAGIDERPSATPSVLIVIILVLELAALGLALLMRAPL